MMSGYVSKMAICLLKGPVEPDMSSEPMPDVDWAGVLAAASADDPEAKDQLIEMVYQELHRIASYLLRKERPGVTFQTTELLDEALVRIFGGKTFHANDRRHFLNIAARQMRNILIDRARSHGYVKRKGFKVGLEDAPQIPVVRSSELVALDDAMKSFAAGEPRAAKVVELKYFGGYTDEETAEILEINIAQVRRDWTYARAWLHDYLSNV